ncbi:MAG: lamin tail domain-containing protein, partial [Planctomycetales bacterium]|nr:lamin tail domain-containing protein [Planctomycetales bacterium]
GPMGLGFSDGTFDDLIATRINPDEVVDGATTILIRTKFNIDSLDDIDRLVLRMKYDDGFVAYINGVEVAQSNIREELAWDSRASSRRNSDNDNFEDFDVSAGVEHLVIGENVLALRAINSSSSSNDQVILAGLVSRSVSFEPNPNGVIYYTTDGTDPRMPDGTVNPAASQVTVGQKITIGQNTHVIARNFDTTDRGPEATKVGVATDWSGPSEYYFVTNQPSLAITEVNYNPIADTDPNSPYGNDAYEFIEIRNTGSTTASLVGVRLNDAVEFDFSHSAITSIAPGGYVLVVANQQAFQQRYGAGLPVAGEYSGNLNNGGEDIDVLDGLGNVITSVNYSDSDVWPIAADGNGSTLELIDSATPVARQSKYYSWRASTAVNGTPGAAPIAPVGVVINEVLANPNQSVDSIELYNATSQTINIGGWYLSDSANDLLDFRIPNGTQIGPNQYLVLNERDFGFGLSANGDQVWLSTTNTSGTLNRIVDAVDFGATKLGQSLGRTPNGSGRFAPMSSLTLGAANAAPQINSLIISELNYNPGAPSAAAQAIDLSLTDNDLEYVEVHNPTALAVNLTNWNIRGGVDYSFDDGVSIPAGGTLIVVPFNPDRVTNQAKLTAFRTHYGLSDSVVIVGGYQGNLSNGDDRVRLMQPEANPADAGNVTRYMVDEVIYDGLTPWPTAADGTGNSLQRLGADLYGNAATSWYAGSPTPGAPVFDGGITGDFNGNGTLDVADIDLLSTQVRTNTGNLTYDVNGDGVLNSEDRTAWLALGGFPIGDSNLDGIFNSGDLVAIFVAGEYEDGVALNSGWGEGDWNGDGDFTTLDLVTAFQEGTYVAAATAFQQTASSIDSV